MSRFNTKSTGTKTQNIAGGKAYSMQPEQELLHAVLTTFIDDKYYESGNDRWNRIKSLVKECDDTYIAKLAFVTRTEFNMRSVTTVLLGELSLKHKGDSLVSKSIEKCAIRVDDITELASYLNFVLSEQVKKGIRHALYKFNRYQLAKYKGERKTSKLVDVFNMVHPKPQFATDEQKQAWTDLINGDLKQFDTWENDVKKLPELIMDNKLGYMALLRNLNNLIKQDVSEEVIARAIAKLTDREQVKKSKQLPFRFLTAYNNVEGNRKFTDAISLAMDIAVDNTPELVGKTLIAIDSSGSMIGGAMQKASIFGATLAKANVNADIILYDTSVKKLQLSTRTPVIDLAKTIEDNANGGGTETSLVFKYAIAEKKFYDRVIIISDNESWTESYCNESVEKWYQEYMKIADPYVYAIDIEGYGTKDIDGGKVIHLTGWSNRLLDFIGKSEEGQSLIKYIKSIEL